MGVARQTQLAVGNHAVLESRRHSTVSPILYQRIILVHRKGNLRKNVDGHGIECHGPVVRKDAEP